MHRASPMVRAGGTLVRVGRAAPGWLAYAGRWGSTVEAPAQQEWFRRAENPVSRTWLQTVRAWPRTLTVVPACEKPCGASVCRQCAPGIGPGSGLFASLEQGRSNGMQYLSW